jgi:AcrR family transcriptional regulator
MGVARPSDADPAAGPRSPQERILAAAKILFYRNGIQATGVEELAGAAGVSKRTLYKLFPGKDQVVAAYLERMNQDLTTNERSLLRDDLPPRERLLALFRHPPASAPFRGCPFHNAAVELATPDHPARAVVLAHKQAVLRLLIETARQAGVDDPETLGHQLAVLFEGATALATSIDDVAPFDDARPLAAALIDQAIPSASQGRHASASEPPANRQEPVQ